jgi:hypothetical protein
MKRMLLLASVTILGLAAAAWGQGSDDDGFERVDRRGQEQFDRLNEGLKQAGWVFVGIGVLLAVIVSVKIISPGRIADSVRERSLKKAVRDVDELLKRIEKEAEAASEEPKKKESIDEGLLAGMVEVAEFEEAEHVPSYVLTVNDLMLDNIRVTLKRLRRRAENDAGRYRDYMFSVVKGIKIITEQSEEAGVHSGLAVDVRQYFQDERRYRDWRKVLARFARKGKYQEVADTFLLFMKAAKEGKPLGAQIGNSESEIGDSSLAGSASQAPPIPLVLNEETLPAIQQMAMEEARNLVSFIQMGESLDEACAWQFEFVRRQQQMHLREEAQRMLSVFLSSERKSLREITKVRMLPCRAWEHVLHVLGVEGGTQLHRRVEDKLLTIQEIIVLGKAFLQTFAKRESLARVYGHGQGAELMMDMHVPELRRETLASLRRVHQTQPRQLDQATETLNEEETPQNGQVKKLIEHYIYHGYNPPGASEK